MPITTFSPPHALTAESAGGRPNIFAELWQGMGMAQKMKQQQLENIIRQAQAKYAEPFQQANTQYMQQRSQNYMPEAEARMGLQRAQTAHQEELARLAEPQFGLEQNKFDLEKAYKQMQMQQIQQQINNPFLGRKLPGAAGQVQALESYAQMLEGGKDNPNYKLAEAIMQKQAGGRQPQVVKLEQAYRDALKEYEQNPIKENKKKIDDIQKSIEKTITSPTALTQLNNISRALSIAPSINYDALTTYAGIKGKARKLEETLTPGTSKERKEYEKERRKMATLEYELALALKIPADKISRSHFHELFNPSDIGMAPKATKEVLENTVKNLLKQAKDTRLKILIPTYGKTETANSTNDFDWSQYEETQ